jgi:YidC/Oxa1 family membrane protein insertase
MRWLCLLLAALLVAPSALTAEEASATAAAVSPASAAAPAAPAATAEPTTWLHPTIENAAARVELSTYRASVVRMSLLGAHVLVLPKWRKDALTPGNTVQDPSKPQSVIDQYNPEYDMNDFITGLGLPDDPGMDGTWHWTPESKQAGTMSLDRAGLTYLVRYAMDQVRPEVHVHLRVENHAAATAQLRMHLRALDGIHVDDPGVEGAFLRYAIHVDGEQGSMTTGSFPADGVTAPLSASGRLDYLALKSRFFAAWWMPGQEGVRVVQDGKATPLGFTLAAAVHGYRVDSAQMESRNPIMQAMLEVSMPAADAPAWSVPAGAALETGWSLAVACMDKDQLAALTPAERELEYTDGYYRFFKSLANIMTWAMRSIAKVVRVYALAVIILTCLIKLALHRLTAKQYASMFKIQKLQPELKYLQQQYKSDRQTLSMKTMELYKKHDVSMLGGCLPMLVQVPVFTGLYQSFYHAADLRGQSFLWIRDLTLPDQVAYLGFSVWPIGPVTINPLPLIYIGVSVWISLMQKPTPGADPTAEQTQKMMRWMPVIIGFVFYSMPAGLVLYFTVQAVLSALEIRVIKRRLGMH